jgi:hypothetical protein
MGESGEGRGESTEYLLRTPHSVLFSPFSPLCPCTSYSVLFSPFSPFALHSPLRAQKKAPPGRSRTARVFVFNKAAER